MSTFTEHYNLIMPSSEDYYDVQDFNENTETLDGLLYEQETAIANVGEKVDGVAEKIGSPGDEGTDTLFGCLSNQSSGELYYVMSPAQNHYKLENAQITPDDSTDDVSGYCLIHRFTAKHSGTVGFSLAFTSGTSHSSSSKCSLYLYRDLIPSRIASLAAGSAVVSNPPEADLVITENIGGINYIPVEKGHTYAFLLTYNLVHQLKITRFNLYYGESAL